MKGIYKLHKPIKIEGREVTELEYDPDAITIDLYNKACERGAMQTVREANDKIHLQLFWAAVVAVNHAVDFTTINQVTGMRDLIEMADLGRNFITGSGESSQSTSEEPLESTQESLTPPQQTSEDDQSSNS